MLWSFFFSCVLRAKISGHGQARMEVNNPRLSPRLCPKTQTQKSAHIMLMYSVYLNTGACNAVELCNGRFFGEFSEFTKNYTSPSHIWENRIIEHWSPANDTIDSSVEVARPCEPAFSLQRWFSLIRIFATTESHSIYIVSVIYVISVICEILLGKSLSDKLICMQFGCSFNFWSNIIQ